jgi:hypothetical protein
MDQKIINANSVNNHHPQYDKFYKSWAKVRDCMDGEDIIKARREEYLPRPKGMDGEYAEAYDAYIERAHFPLIVSYALQGALGVVITKIPEFNVPKELEYILKEATRDGRSIQQFFLDVVIEVFQTGRVPILVDVVKEKNEFRFVQYRAEDFINWKTSITESKRSLILGVIAESVPSTEDIFSHTSDSIYRVLVLDENSNYTSRIFGEREEYVDFYTVPLYMGSPINEIPLFVAGSINNSYDVQPIPLISVANCSVQIYRKEADLANSEFLSCNPTLVLVGASVDDNIPNVVGSSVMIVIPNEAARVFYTTTDTAALTHVSSHIESLYEEAIRHGVAILDARKGVEAAEALRIRQATQSASVYSVYLAAMNAIRQGLLLMCRWAGYNEDDVIIDAPSSLTHGIPDATIIRQIVEGFGQGVVPLSVIHRYLISSGLLDQTVGYEEYVKMLLEQQKLKEELGGVDEESEENEGVDGKTKSNKPKTAKKGSSEDESTDSGDQS